MPGVAYALLGPTASGKSRIALELAKHLPIEIISVDSAQVYRGMDIGTAKPSAAERATAPHHLIDLIDPDQSYSVGQWRSAAINAVNEILARGKVPLLVGGTMLYFRSLVSGLDNLPEANEFERAAIDLEAMRRGWPALHGELQIVDPQAASRIAPNDAQRIQRGLEVFRLTGKPLSSMQSGAKADLPFVLHSVALVFGDRALLHRRIEERFDAMLEAGLIEEVESLRKKFTLTANLPSMRAVGYRQIFELLEGKVNNETMRGRAIAATRQLAKRQMTWLRSLPGLLRLDAGGAQHAAVALELLLDQIGKPLGRAGR